MDPRAIRIPLRTGAAPPPAPPSDASWRWSTLLWAPHRLGFAAAHAVLLAATLWWVWVLTLRVWPWAVPAWHLPPTVGHAAIMVMGFMPLFVVGFQFTAGPKWLGMPPPEAHTLLAPVVWQVAGWAMWLVGTHLALVWAVCGLLLVAAGQAWITARFTALVWRSPASDRWHAGIIAVAGWSGVIHLLGLALALVSDAVPLALVWVRSALWLSVLPIFAAALHRLVPFFTSNVLPMVEVWRPWWVLIVLLLAAGVEAGLDWGHALTTDTAPRALMLARGLFELVVGAIVIWLALVWGLVQAMSIRLLAMLHLGVLWLGLAFCLLGATQLLGLRTGVPVLGLGAWHALTMGFFGSILYAMVTRVSCGHGGRKLLADEATWWGFWILQLAVVLRVGSALWPVESVGVWVAALLWTAAVLPWSARLLSWYGRPRPDGRPG